MMPNHNNLGWPANQPQQWMQANAGQVVPMGPWGPGSTAAMPFPFMNQHPPAQSQYMPRGVPMWNSNQWQQWGGVPNHSWGQIPQSQAVPPPLPVPPNVNTPTFPSQPHLPFSAPLPPQDPPQVPPPPQEIVPAALEAKSEEEKLFDDQFAEWESKFRDWKEENKNHPDKKALAEYEVQWEGWRQQLLQKREQMRKQKEETQQQQQKTAKPMGLIDQSQNLPHSVQPQVYPPNKISDGSKAQMVSSQAPMANLPAQVRQMTGPALISHHSNQPGHPLRPENAINMDQHDRNSKPPAQSSLANVNQHACDFDQRRGQFQAPNHNFSDVPVVHPLSHDEDLRFHPQHGNNSDSSSQLKRHSIEPVGSSGVRPLFPDLKRPDPERDNEVDFPQSARKRARSSTAPGGDRINEGLINRLLRQSGSIDPSSSNPLPFRPKSPHCDTFGRDQNPLFRSGQDDPQPLATERVGRNAGNDLSEFAPIVKDYSNQRPSSGLAVEPVVFDYYHLPGRFGQYSSLATKETVVFDYWHGQTTEKTAIEPEMEPGRPPVTFSRPKTMGTAPLEPLVPIPVPVPPPIPQPVPPPMPQPVKAPPTQLFPSAAAIEQLNTSTKLVAKSQFNDNFGQNAKIDAQDKQLADQVPSASPAANAPVPAIEVIKLKDLLVAPGRNSRPEKLVIILRGLPGSGKSYFARLLKEKELAMGGSAPRILSIDDYYMMDDGVPPAWSSELEEQYRQNLIKCFKRNLDDGHFTFIIVDSLNLRSSDVLDLSTPARMRGFGVYLVDLPASAGRIGVTRKCTDEDVRKINQLWEAAPNSLPHLDVDWLLDPIKEAVGAEVASSPENVVTSTTALLDDDSQNSSNDVAGDAGGPPVSRWEMIEQTEEKLDKLDGIVKRLSNKLEKPASLEDWLQLPDDYDQRKCDNGKKRVRWADIEEKNQQEKMRAVGFVVGQTDWSRMTDPTFGESALTKTKYI